ncbi:MAG: AMP-binding protein [Verrucomicrobia bacterium]|nr:AMP-binding protein [Verrucomicrobiota bacterium]
MNGHASFHLAKCQKPFFYSQQLASLAESKPELPCLYRGQLTTAEKVWDDVLRCATWMQRNGVERGSVVLFCLSADHADTQTLFMAASHAGATVTLVPAHASEARLLEIAHKVSPACIFLDGGTASLRALIDSTLTIWMTPGLSRGDWDEVELDEIFTTRPAYGLPFPGQTDDTALLLFDDQENSPADIWTHRRLGEMAGDDSETRLMSTGALSLAA